MDEPFSALDVHTRQLMETELLTLWDVTGSPPLGTEPRSPGTGTPAPPGTPRLKTHRALRHARPRRGDRARRRSHRALRRAGQPRRRATPGRPRAPARPDRAADLAGFVDLYRAIWSVLREEVVRSQRTRSQPWLSAAPRFVASGASLLGVGRRWRCGRRGCRDRLSSIRSSSAGRARLRRGAIAAGSSSGSLWPHLAHHAAGIAARPA